MAQFNFIDWESDKELIAVYTGQLRNVGQFNRNIFTFQLANKERVHSWDYVDLRTKLYSIPFGMKLKIIYKGMITSAGGKHPHKEFEVKVIK